MAYQGNVSDTLCGALERMIDQTSLLDVLIGLELVCGEKAEHIRVNWQDRKQAAVWDRASKVCGNAARANSVETVSA